VAAIVFDRSFNGASFDDHDCPVRCCRAVPRSNDCQSCHTRDKWWEGDGCVDRTDRVHLQPHAKLVAIQTEACPPVRSTQPANALHALLYKIHTVSCWKRQCNCLDCHEFSSTPLRFRPHPRMPMQLSFRPHPRMQRCFHGTARQHCTGQSWASNDVQLKDLSNTRALKHLAPLATDEGSLPAWRLSPAARPTDASPGVSSAGDDTAPAMSLADICTSDATATSPRARSPAAPTVTAPERARTAATPPLGFCLRG